MSAKPTTILVVDDHPGSRYVLAKILQRARYEVKEAATGMEALRLTAEKPDLVILDVGLPDLSGYEVCQRIKSDPATSSIPVLHLSASFAEVENRVRGLEGGADGYLTYPVEPPELLANVQALLRVREAERKLRQQRELLAVTLSSIGDGVITTDTEARITFLNPLAEALTGWSQDEATGRPFGDVFRIINAETGRPAEDLVAQAIRQGKTVGLANHTLLIARDGATTPIEESAAPIRDHEGRIHGVVLAFRSIAERRRAERALHQSERELADFFDNASLGLRWVGPDGIILRVNRAELDLLGYAREEYVGRHIGEFHVDQGVVTDVLRRLAGGEVVQDCKARMRCKDGSIKHVLIDSSVLWQDGQFIHTRCFTRDVTDRRRAEEEVSRTAAELRSSLKEAEEGRSLLQALMEHVPVGITIADAPDVRIRMVSRAGIEMTGKPRQALEGIPMNEHAEKWDFYRADGATPASNEELPLTRATRHGEVVKDEIWILRAADRRQVSLLCNAGPIRDAGGAITGGVIAWHDITERQRMAEALREEGRRKDEFLAMLAHELRNPLAPIRNAVQIIRLTGSQNPAVEQVGAMVERQVQHMTRLVDDLLDVSRVSRGKIQLRKEVVDLAAVIARAVESVRPLVDARSHELALTLPARPVRLEGDVTRLVQVVANLLNNAAKYTDPGGRITLTAERQGQQVELRVQDTGVGIAREALPYVFDLFTQVDRSLDRSQGGLGIGLTLVKSLVEMHGGSVSAHSDGPGEGSEFVIRLPALPEEGDQERGHEERAATHRVLSSARRRVLVVDDNVDAAVSLAMLLQLQRHEVNVAHDGQEAIEAARRHRPEIVFLDIGLPGMDGYEVARQLRQELDQDGLVLVATTGYGSEEDRCRALAAGFDAHLVKPAKPEVLETFLARGGSGLEESAGT